MFQSKSERGKKKPIGRTILKEHHFMNTNDNVLRQEKMNEYNLQMHMNQY